MPRRVTLKQEVKLRGLLELFDRVRCRVERATCYHGTMVPEQHCVVLPCYLAHGVGKRLVAGRIVGHS